MHVCLHLSVYVSARNYDYGRQGHDDDNSNSWYAGYGCGASSGGYYDDDDDDDGLYQGGGAYGYGKTETTKMTSVFFTNSEYPYTLGLIHKVT